MKGNDVLFGSFRNFFVLGHRARTDSEFNINDLCGSGGRLDGLMRCINASLFLSHDIRRDTAIHAVMMGPSDPPKILSILGSCVKYLNPDERSTAALVKKALEIPMPNEIGKTLRSTPGIYVTRGGLEHVLDHVRGPSFILDENGVDIHSGWNDRSNIDGRTPLNFFLSDDRDFEEDELSMISSKAESTLSISPKVLHSDHCVTIIHNIIDRISHP